ncbi:MAG: hypothetical protein HY799_04985 [Nitrosomonadales bacterium]|nr:hypothetical protein [Nitrosomonadales bacterium]
MNKYTLKPLCLAIGLAMAGSASATSVDFSGSNFYMKFLDGNMMQSSSKSISTDGGPFGGNADQGQFTELNLIFKATISPQVEAGGRVQSRSSAAYWSEYGGFGQEGTVANDSVNHQKMMKLRGAYIELSPGYDWLSQVRIGTSDWGMFDPFTVGKIRYIDRDNINGLYFKGPVASGSTWEIGRVSFPQWNRFNWANGTLDSAQYNDAVYIAQVKVPVGPAKLAASYQTYNEHNLAATANTYTGTNSYVFSKNTVSALKAEGSTENGIDLRGAYYRSTFDLNSATIGANWGNTPMSSITDKAIKLDVDWATPVDGLNLSYQYFNIGAGYYSGTAARRESDVLLTEGSEAAWYGWGNATWSGGATADYTQAAANKNVADNGFIDFNESPAESAVAWKGHTFVGKFEAANTPMSLELTRIGYNNNWQNYSATGPLGMYALNQDRSTNIVAFKLNHNFDVMGGVDMNFKLKRVDNKDKVSTATAADDRDVLDSGMTASVGNQLFADLYGTLSFGRYIRDIKSGANTFNNSKSIYGVKFAYNLPGFEMGMLTQWIRGSGNPTETAGASVKIQQYRMKAYAQVNF